MNELLLPNAGMMVEVSGFEYGKYDRRTTSIVKVLGYYISENRNNKVFIIAQSFSEAHGVELFEEWDYVSQKQG